MTAVDVGDVRRLVVKRLGLLKEELGFVPTAAVEDAAAEAERGVSTVWRWLQQDGVTGGSTAASPTGFEFDNETMGVFYAVNGDLAKARRHLLAAGKDVPSYSTMRRARDVADQALIKGATEGSDGFRQGCVYLTQAAPHRNHTWVVDHFECEVYVNPGDGRTPVRPWITVVEDDATRVCVSLVVTYGRPRSDEVVAALAAGMVMKPTPDPNVQIGGRPVRAVWDQGGELLSDHVSTMMLRLGTIGLPVAAYSPHLKGKVERLCRTIQNECVNLLHGYIHGPTTWTGKQPFRGEDDQLLTRHEFDAHISKWVDEYNFERSHWGLRGRVPLKLWAADTEPLQPVSSSDLWEAMLAEDDRTVGGSGIRFRHVDYVAPEIARLRGQTVEVRFLPSDPSFIEVFYKGAHLCTAFPSADLSTTGRRQLLDIRWEQYEQFRDTVNGATAARYLRSVTRPEQDNGLASAFDAAKARTLSSDVDGLLAALEEANLDGPVGAEEATSSTGTSGETGSEATRDDTETANETADETGGQRAEPDEGLAALLAAYGDEPPGGAKPKRRRR